MTSIPGSLDLTEAHRFLREALGEWVFQDVSSHFEGEADLGFQVPVNQSFTRDEEDMLDGLIDGVLEHVPDDPRIDNVFVWLMHRGSVTYNWFRFPKHRLPS